MKYVKIQAILFLIIFITIITYDSYTYDQCNKVFSNNTTTLNNTYDISTYSWELILQPVDRFHFIHNIWDNPSATINILSGDLFITSIIEDKQPRWQYPFFNDVYYYTTFYTSNYEQKTYDTFYLMWTNTNNTSYCSHWLFWIKIKDKALYLWKSTDTWDTSYIFISSINNQPATIEIVQPQMIQ